MTPKKLYFNWKMNPIKLDNVSSLIQTYSKIVSSSKHEIKLFPPSIFVPQIIKLISGKCVGLQDVSEHKSGAFTGEISAPMTKGFELFGSLVGHSETRERQKLTHDTILEKIKALLSENLTPIICFGYIEGKKEIEGKELAENFKSEIEFYLKNLQDSRALEGLENKQIILAYEPVWAIGSGKTASLELIEFVLSEVKNFIQQNYPEVLSNISLLYGGSVNSVSAIELGESEIIDGFLIGGSSLKPEELVKLAGL